MSLGMEITFSVLVFLDVAFLTALFAFISGYHTEIKQSASQKESYTNSREAYSRSYELYQERIETVNAIIDKLQKRVKK